MGTPYGNRFHLQRRHERQRRDPKRALLVTEATGDQQLFAYRDSRRTPFHIPALQAGSASIGTASNAAAIRAQGKTNFLTCRFRIITLAPGQALAASSEAGVSPLSDTLGAVAEPYDPALGCGPAASRSRIRARAE